MQELHESEMFRSVLNEMLSELKQLHNTTKEVGKTLSGLSERVDKFDQRLENLQVLAPPTDLQPLKDALAEFNREVKEILEGMQEVFARQMQKIADTLAAEPKPIVRRLSLFPENDYRGSYKYFIKALFLATLGVCLVGALYAFGRQWLEQRAAGRVPVQERVMSFPGGGDRPATTAPSPERTRKAVRRHRKTDSGRVLSMDTGR